MPQGVIIKGIGGFYYVRDRDRVVECRARGKFRNENITPLVGDYVEISEQNGGCSIDSIYPRRNTLVRPSVANVDQALIVFAAVKPEPNFNLLDRFLLIAEYNKLNAVVCINKIDLAIDKIDLNQKVKPYYDAGYKIIYTSTKTGYGISELSDCLNNKTTVFAGPSGVGKSSLLKSLCPSLNVKIGEISQKLERGKHTTRHSELIEIGDNGLVVDTPGFSSLEIESINKDEVQYLFPEFKDLLGHCRFSGCSHINEPGCSIKEGVEEGSINQNRYNSYTRLYTETSKARRNYK